MLKERRLVRTVRGRRVSARFSRHRPPRVRPGPGWRFLPLLAYRQLDRHSCGFLAALTVVHYFRPDVPPEDVLAVARPSRESGCDQRRVVSTLKQFGIEATYRESLSVKRLYQMASWGLPVIVTVWLDGCDCDHWTVVRGIDLAKERIYLANYTSGHGMGLDDFGSAWFPRGGGLVCKRA